MINKRLKALAVFVCALLITALVPGVGLYTGPAQAEGELPILKFDFGTESSPVAPGYTRVANTTVYDSDRGFGLSKVADTRDRGNPDDLRRDFVIADHYSFLVDLPNGEYTVQLIAGDAIATNTTRISIEGVDRGSISSGSGEYATFIGDVTVADGQMNFDLGKSSRINALVIYPATGSIEIELKEKVISTEPAVTIHWNAIDDADGYSIYRKANDENDLSKVGESLVPEYTDTSVEIGITYEYRVAHKIDESIESAMSEPLFVSIIDESVNAPDAPNDLKLESASENNIAFRWQPVEQAIVYYVYKAKSPEGPFVKVAETTESAFTDSAVTTVSHYYYKIAAVNQGGISETSSVLTTPITKVVLRQMEQLDRALVAVKTDEGVYVGWRLLGTDPTSIAFNLYRDGQKLNAEPITSSTNYLDVGGNEDSTYAVSAILHGEEQALSESVNVWGQNYLDVPLERPEGGTTPDGVDFVYHANDASVGDLDGDGEYEIVLKWDPSNSKDNAHDGYTGEVFIDAYKLDGTLLWRISMGDNVRAGAHYTQFMVYDLDGDGIAEVAMRTADGTVDGVGQVIGDPNADYRDSRGRILTGPEYLTIFDGTTGAALYSTDFEPARGDIRDWGDNYGNRSDRFLAGIAYLDGERPSLIMARGYYEKTVLVAYNWRDGELTRLWTFNTDDPGNEDYAGQGNHNLSIGDVDGDGKDEIIYGAMAVDHDGTGLYTTGLGHGDAMHLGDLNPNRPGLEVFQVHESSSAEYGKEFRDAATGEVIWGIHTGQDTGRGMAADIDPNYPGAEVWASSRYGLFSSEGEKISDRIPSSVNFGIWWDGDLLRELLDHNRLGDAGIGRIDKWDYENHQSINLLTAEGTLSNNSTKGNPSLQADLFGDWREEAIWRTEDSSALRIYTTMDLTEHRIYTLMHDPIYRLGIAWQNVAYNQPPHPSFFLGHGMEEPPVPNIYINGVLSAKVDVNPNQINLKSQGGKNALTAYIELPSDNDVSEVNRSTVRLNVNGETIFAQAAPSAIGDEDRNGIADLMVKFDRQQVIRALADQQGSIDFSITGNLQDGTSFIGQDTFYLKH